MTNIHVFHPNLQPSARSVPAMASALRAISSQARARRGQKVCLLLSLLRRQCGKYCADRASEPPRNMRQPILCPGRTCEHGDAAAPPQVSSVRHSSVVRAFVGTNSRNACDAVGETLLDDALAGGETSVASVTKKATPTKPLPQHGKSQLQRHFGPGEAFGIGTGGHPPVLKLYKTSQGASRSMAKASSNDIILGLGKPLRSGQGAIRQFSNPIKLERGPAAAWLKPAPTTFWVWGSLWDRDGGHPSVLKSHKTRKGASRSMAKASSNDILGLGKLLRSGQGAIRQFWNPIKSERGPAAAWLKPAPTTFWAWGSIWDRDRGPSVSFETP